MDFLVSSLKQKHMSCAICHVSVAIIHRKAHMASVHGYPDCPTCNRTIKNINMFETHVLGPHITKKCQLNTCEHQIVCGKELQHAMQMHSYPECFCGETIQSNFAIYYRHVNSHKKEDFGVKCALCDEVVPTWDTRHHATEMHGFPVCSVCKITINTNFKMFYQHLVAHRTEPGEKCVACNEVVHTWKSREHATVVHGFPRCETCAETTAYNFGNFLTHVASHEVESRCPRCPELVRQKNQTSHAASAHGWPECSVCSKIFETLPLFYCHVRRCKVNDSEDSDDERSCPLCDASICTDKPLLVRHFTEKHGFAGFWCEKCGMGRGVKNLTSLSFVLHVANCLNGKKYECGECRVTFGSRHRLKEHHCVPFGTVVATAEEYARRVHGRNEVLHLPGLKLRVEYDLSGYVKGLPALLPSAGMTVATSFEETSAEAARRERGHGRKYKLSEDSRIFVENVSTVPWLYRFMGGPWELGDSLMPDMKLALVHRFKERPSRDVWLFIINRFDRFKSTVAELDEVKRILRVVTLPPGTDPRYRDMEHIRLFSKQIQGDAAGILHQVEYVCDNERLTSRQVGKELRALERATRKRLNLPVENLPVGSVMDYVVRGTSSDESARVLKRARFERGETTAKGRAVVGAGAVERQRATNGRLVVVEAQSSRALVTGLSSVAVAGRALHVADDDPCRFQDVCDFLDERERVPTGASGQILSDVYAELKMPVAGDVEQGSEWDVRFWEMIYTVFRDFVLYFVASKTMKSLKLYSNFINEEPTWRDLEELLRGFGPFIAQDKGEGVDTCVGERACALERGLLREVLWLKNLHRHGTSGAHLPCSEVVKVDRELPRVKRLRLHRHRKVK